MFVNKYKRRYFDTLNSKRHNGINGLWVGSGEQAKGPDGNPIQMSINMEFTATKKNVTGTGDYFFKYDNKDQKAKFKYSGGFLHDRFLLFEYINIDPSVIQLGSMLFELSNDGKTLEGRFQGYGVKTKGIVWGTVTLEKIEVGQP